jgi:serine/threonine protein phosphatase PrpC
MPTDTPATGGPLDVATALVQMSAAVQAGDFAEAAAIGARAPVPLSIPKAALRLGRVLSEGAQAAVYEAELTSGSAPGCAPLAVAVKRARIRTAQDLVRFRREVALLAELRHPHVVRLLGARLLPPDYCMVLGLEAGSAVGAGPAGWAVAAALGAQVASAVAHMHAAGVVHRDLKPGNVLLSGDGATARLADLGISARVVDPGEGGEGAGGKPSGGFHTHVVGTLEYMAPEVLLRAPHSPASDVFALAVTVNEMASGRVPYSDCTRDNPLAHTILEMGYGRQELSTAVAAEGLRPTPAPGAPPALLRLLRQCWDALPERRPAAAVVAAALAGLAAQLAAELGGDGGSGLAAAPPPPLVPLPPLPAAPAEAAPPPVEEGNPAWAEALLAAHAAAGAAPELPIGSFATPGLRGEDKMEDRCAVVRGFNGLPGCHLMAAFDGHRGPEASDWLAASLERHLAARWACSAGPGEALRRALLDADAAFRTQQDAEWARRGGGGGGAPRRFPGSTAVVALLVGRRLAVANLGDSRAVLCRGGTAVELTRDQTAEREDERARVAAAGGEVSVRMGGWRVGAAGLQVTRSVGDADVKGQGVTAEAEVGEWDLTPDDSFLLLATDGVWEWVGSGEAVELVHDTVKQPAMCAQRLVAEALARGSRDNATAVVAFLGGGGGGGGGVPTAERVFHGGRLKYGGGGGAAKRVAARLVEDEVRETY